MTLRSSRAFAACSPTLLARMTQARRCARRIERIPWMHINTHRLSQIDMTAPVLVEVHEGVGPTCGNTFTVSFYAPPKKELPTPTNKVATIERKPPMRVYVADFDGFMSERVAVRQAAMLAKKLEKAGVDVDADAPYWTASYDSPFRILHRHNEVWLKAA